MPRRPVLAIHAGAGDHSGPLREREAEVRAALAEALAFGGAVLERGADAVEAVQAAIVVMESFELFNAGRGSALCSDGSVQMSAALMRSDLTAGAVAGVRHTEHPILAAGAVLRSPQVLMVGEAADALAADAGIPQRPGSYFITERQTARLREGAGGRDHATVGAVCLGADGVLAAGTSTGGIRAQPPGRVGDTPIIGAGTWADSTVAVSCTGDGEAFIRVGAARYIGALVEQGLSLDAATDRALEAVERLGAHGGLIALDADGAAATPYMTKVMPRGIWRPGEQPAVWVI